MRWLILPCRHQSRRRDRQAFLRSAMAITTCAQLCFLSSLPFLAGMNLVVLSNDAFFLLLCGNACRVASCALSWRTIVNRQRHGRPAIS